MGILLSLPDLREVGIGLSGMGCTLSLRAMASEATLQQVAPPHRPTAPSSPPHAAQVIYRRGREGGRENKGSKEEFERTP